MGGAGLELLAQLTLGKRLLKDPSVRLSTWSQPLLSPEQIKYAALDATVGTDVFFYLVLLSDFAARLPRAEVVSGKMVDIVPSHGNVSVMNTRAAVAKIAPVPANGKWINPLAGAVPATCNLTASRCLVTIDKVLAQNFVVPWLKTSSKEPVTLGDFGDTPFDILVPYSMLAPQLAMGRVYGSAHPTAPPPTAPPQQPAGAPPPTAPLPTAPPPTAPPPTAPPQQPADAPPPTAPSPTAPSPTAPPPIAPPPDEPLPADALETAREALGEGDCMPDLEEPHLEIDAEAEPLNQQQVELVRAAAAAACDDSGAEPEGVQLKPAPECIRVKFSTTQGDAFHYMDRTKPPMHHDMKKPFFTAMRDAWFMFEPHELEAVKAVQRAKGKTDAEIETDMYYNFNYWRERVRRVVPPPPIHYRRVRAVYATFGTLVDAKSGKPLFNDTAWKKANGVLEDILAGYAADLPDVVYYHQRLDKKGNPAVDEDGLPLLDCLRGTNDTELAHKLLIMTFGGWVAGVEMSDYLLAEFRHRYNHNMSERKRLGFPKVRRPHVPLSPL